MQKAPAAHEYQMLARSFGFSTASGGQHARVSALSSASAAASSPSPPAALPSLPAGVSGDPSDASRASRALHLLYVNAASEEEGAPPSAAGGAAEALSARAGAMLGCLHVGVKEKACWLFMASTGRRMSRVWEQPSRRVTPRFEGVASHHPLPTTMTLDAPPSLSADACDVAQQQLIK